MERYTIICVDVKSSDNEPILVQNYGVMTLKQAKEKFEEIYQDESEEYSKENIIKTDYYIGINFKDNELDTREYYLQRLNDNKYDTREYCFKDLEREGIRVWI